MIQNSTLTEKKIRCILTRSNPLKLFIIEKFRCETHRSISTKYNNKYNYFHSECQSSLYKPGCTIILSYRKS